MPKDTITISIERYAYPRRTLRFEGVPATIVGDLAVHRPVYWYDGETPTISDKGWAVSHKLNGLGVGSMLPERFTDRQTRKELIAWAEAAQDACPAFFEAARVDDRDTMKALAAETRAKGRSL